MKETDNACSQSKKHHPEQRITTEDLKGQVWVLNVWASWCVSCRAEHEVITAFAKTGMVPVYGLNYKDEPADAIGWLTEELEAYFPREAEILNVSLTDYDRSEVTKVVRAVVEAYLQEVVEAERGQKHRELADLEAVLAQREQRIRTLRTRMKSLADDLGTADPEALRMQVQTSLQHLGLYRQELTSVQINLRKFRSEYDVEGVKHAARIASELGADIVKVNYTGSVSSFRQVVDGCPIPVVIAGGERAGDEKGIFTIVTSM